MYKEKEKAKQESHNIFWVLRADSLCENNAVHTYGGKKWSPAAMVSQEIALWSYDVLHSHVERELTRSSTLTGRR